MKVLIGVDGTDSSLHALEETVTRTAKAGDELTVGIIADNSDRSFTEIQSDVTEIINSSEVDAIIRHLDGDPGSQLVELAESEDFDKLVIGGGKRSPMGKIQIGNLAEFILLNSRITVSLIR
ncbi:MAG: universal stress protein UspA related nucleotide-binding protein [Haloquadratum walsbyi J07HQW1]|jgi:Universal stress protein family.|uniref:Universal stress protein UspA related nucleotide-binding protein n=1 Tax=Haloquadratum walsbyi J07HQW1 TaxID=1238424 RepID=U1MKS7_9EURY|nr:MAG: universal stress protein UspA related nucleotide-binding protein [Haloquadratum walsbyi J07HQW1]